MADVDGRQCFDVALPALSWHPAHEWTFSSRAKDQPCPLRPGPSASPSSQVHLTLSWPDLVHCPVSATWTPVNFTPLVEDTPIAWAQHIRWGCAVLWTLLVFSQVHLSLTHSLMRGVRPSGLCGCRRWFWTLKRRGLHAGNLLQPRSSTLDLHRA